MTKASEIKNNVAVLNAKIESLKNNPAAADEIKKLEEEVEGELMDLMILTKEAGAELLGAKIGVYTFITISEAEKNFKEMADTAMELGVFTKEEIDDIIPTIQEYWNKKAA